jgi:hypothetical protein
MPAHCEEERGAWGKPSDDHLKVVRKFPVLHGETVTRRENYKNGRLKRTWTEPLRELKETIIDLSPEHKCSYDGLAPQPLSAENMPALEALIDAEIQLYLDKMRDPLVVCPKCHGYGVTEPDGSAAK